MQVPLGVLGLHVPDAFAGLQGHRLQTPPLTMHPQFQYVSVPHRLPWFPLCPPEQVGGFLAADWMHHAPTAVEDLGLLDE